jgi:LacI family transcriptional regulator
VTAALQFDFNVNGGRHAAWGNLIYCQPEKSAHRLLLPIRDWRRESLDDVLQRERRKILGLKKLPTAVVCASDQVAIRLIKFFATQKLKVPRDVSVVSYGADLAAQQHRPALTAVDFPMELIGRALPELIERRLADTDAAPLSLQFETVLREGKSCRKIAAE